MLYCMYCRHLQTAIKVLHCTISEAFAEAKSEIFMGSLAEDFVGLKIYECDCPLRNTDNFLLPKLWRTVQTIQGLINCIGTKSKCRYLIKLTCKETLRQVFICLSYTPPPRKPLYVTDGNIMYLTDASRFLISCVIQHYAPVVGWGGGGTDA